jgi:hypothetical protein
MHSAWQHADDGVPDDLQVAPRAPVGDVFKIRVDPAQKFLFRIGFAAPAADLRQPGHAWLDAVAGGVLFGDRLERAARRAGAGRMRPRPDQRHRSRQHVQELRQFVERCVTQHGTHPGDPRVVAGGLQKGPVICGAVMHGAKFQHHEAAAVQADAFLPKQRRPFTGQLDRGGDDQHRQSHDCQADRCQHDVHGALDQRVAGRDCGRRKAGMAEGDRHQGQGAAAVAGSIAGVRRECGHGLLRLRVAMRSRVAAEKLGLR